MDTTMAVKWANSWGGKALMYTGYSIRHQKIYRNDGETEFHLHDSHIHCYPDQPTGFCLAQSLTEGVKHIYGPSGYTKFYVKGGQIYGPSTRLPWLDDRDAHQAAETRAL